MLGPPGPAAGGRRPGKGGMQGGRGAGAQGARGKPAAGWSCSWVPLLLREMLSSSSLRSLSPPQVTPRAAGGSPGAGAGGGLPTTTILARRVATVASSTSDRAGPDELVIGTTWEFASHSKALLRATLPCGAKVDAEVKADLEVRGGAGARAAGQRVHGGDRGVSSSRRPSRTTREFRFEDEEEEEESSDYELQRQKGGRSHSAGGDPP